MSALRHLLRIRLQSGMPILQLGDGKGWLVVRGVERGWETYKLSQTHPRSQVLLLSFDSHPHHNSSTRAFQARRRMRGNYSQCTLVRMKAGAQCLNSSSGLVSVEGGLRSEETNLPYISDKEVPKQDSTTLHHFR